MSSTLTPLDARVGSKQAGIREGSGLILYM